MEKFHLLYQVYHHKSFNILLTKSLVKINIEVMSTIYISKTMKNIELYSETFIGEQRRREEEKQAIAIHLGRDLNWHYIFYQCSLLPLNLPGNFMLINLLFNIPSNERC